MIILIIIQLIILQHVSGRIFSSCFSVLDLNISKYLYIK